MRQNILDALIDTIGESPRDGVFVNMTHLSNRLNLPWPFLFTLFQEHDIKPNGILYHATGGFTPLFAETRIPEIIEKLRSHVPSNPR